MRMNWSGSALSWLLSSSTLGGRRAPNRHGSTLFFFGGGGGGGVISPFLCACCLAGSLAVLPTNGNRIVGRRECSVHVKQTQEYYIWIAILRVSPVQRDEKFHCRFLSDFAVEWKSGRREKGNAVPMSKRHGRN